MEFPTILRSISWASKLATLFQSRFPEFAIISQENFNLFSFLVINYFSNLSKGITVNSVVFSCFIYLKYLSGERVKKRFSSSQVALIVLIYTHNVSKHNLTRWSILVANKLFSPTRGRDPLKQPPVPWCNTTDSSAVSALATGQKISRVHSNEMLGSRRRRRVIRHSIRAEHMHNYRAPFPAVSTTHAFLNYAYVVNRARCLHTVPTERSW